MKRKVCLLLALLTVFSCFLGCMDLLRQQVKLALNPYIADYTGKMTSVYSESEEEGLKLYQKLFDPSNKITIQIHIPKEEIAKQQLDYYAFRAQDKNMKSEIYRKADLTVVIGEDRYEIEEVGIRQKGNLTYYKPFAPDTGIPNLCSYKISFDETFDDPDVYGADVKVWTSDAERKARKSRTFASLEKLDIKWNSCYDNTFIREIYATQFFTQSGLLVQKISLAQTSVNGDNYGVYDIYEPVDKRFLEKRLPEEALGGDLYKLLWSEYATNGVHTRNRIGATYQLNNSYGIQDNQRAIQYNFNIKTNKKSTDHADLIRFLRVVNQDSITKEELESVLDPEEFARFMAALYFCGDPDDIRQNYNNQYLYFRKDNGKAVFIVYDNDQTLGICYNAQDDCSVFDPYSNESLGRKGPQQNPLIRKTITHDALPELAYVRDLYADALKSLAESKLLADDKTFLAMYENAKALYEDDAEPYMTFGNQKHPFFFSLEDRSENKDVIHMSFARFRARILETYRAATP